MATLVEVLPKVADIIDGTPVILLSPASGKPGEWTDGTVNPEWFKKAFATIANATLPLSQANYTALKNIGDCWAVNAINWRKTGVFEVTGIKADALIDEEEALIVSMYPPKEETPEETPDQPTEGE